ncbi:MAG: hypothetical protein AXW14_10545 [Alteromonas sp. Nap_26]|nr:MAG: hypothetical protein AXW14_10545 [Alteromonas sp. Nap_26]
MLAILHRFYITLVLLFLSPISWALSDNVLTPSHLSKPVSANILDAEFEKWRVSLIAKQEQLVHLLSDAGIETENVRYLNSLIYSNSPYLLRHSVNPVNWIDDYSLALSRANDTNKLIFLSIGYSTCHWCHVMEKESFLDIDVATVLNKHFVSVKLDREIDVELDRLFSEKQQLIKGESGWPISAILTPDGQLFWTDAYVGKAELLKLLKNVSAIWQQKPERILQIAKNLTIQFSVPKLPEVEWKEDTLQERLTQVTNLLDQQHGGLKGEVKFPNAALLELLLYQYQVSPSQTLESQIRLFLDSMIEGGLWDHLRGGFFRYAQVSNWHQPHFEKMLYNQALLISVYAKASHLFNIPRYEEVARQTIAFVYRDMRHGNEGFYSAIDADYQGKEGGYYLFSIAELEGIEPALKQKYRWMPSHDNTLFQPYSDSVMEVQPQDNPLVELKDNLPPPHIDKKVLTAWNALLVASLFDAHVYLQDPVFLERGIELLNYLLEKHVSQNVLYRAFLADTAFGQATLEDYAWLNRALLKAYALTQKTSFLDQAIDLQNKSTEYLTKQSNKLNWMNDQEFISPLSVIAEAGREISKLGGTTDREWRRQIQEIKQRVSNEFSDHFSAYQLLLQSSHSSLEPLQIFAKGKGRAWLKESNENSNGDYIIEITMAPGWHINSNKPLDKSLIATEIVASSNQTLQVSYPTPVKRKLGFSQKPLSLYEGQLSIPIARDKKAPLDKFILKTQACSEKLCLLPETLTFFVAR